MRRRNVLIGSIALLCAPALPTRAGEIKEFDPKAFSAAQEAGEGIVLFVHAPW